MTHYCFMLPSFELTSYSEMTFLEKVLVPTISIMRQRTKSRCFPPYTAMIRYRYTMNITPSEEQ